NQILAGRLLNQSDPLGPTDAEWSRFSYSNQPGRAGRGEESSLVYRRPSYSGDDRLFFDLASYAAGMNTSRADALGVLEAETTPGLFGKPGRIDDDAHRLFETARSAGWQSLQFPADGERPAWTVVFDGTGRYAYERTLPPGIRERLVCDGKTLLHLYPELH